MDECFVIQGGRCLNGKIDVSGAKNAALKLIAAALLTRKRCTLENVPRITDVMRMEELAGSIGAETEWKEGHTLSIRAPEIHSGELLFESVRSLRASIGFLAPLAVRSRNFRFPHPGGDQIGARSVNPHLDVLRAFGAKTAIWGQFYDIHISRLHPADLFLSEMSVTATEIAVMIAASIDGKSVVRGAAAEPAVQDLCHMLIRMGARIHGIGTHTLTIRGASELGGVRHWLIPDPVEAGTFITLLAATHGRGIIHGIVPEHLGMELKKFGEAGVLLHARHARRAPHGWGYTVADVFVRPSTRLKALRKVHNMPYPGFNPDLLPLFAVLMTQAQGSTIMHDWMYEGRLKYVDELVRMGADAVIMDPHRVLITGPTPLYGREIISLDIRAGATLVIAGLLAEGETMLHDVAKIDRGYEHLEERLEKLGAHIKRISSRSIKSRR